MCSRIDMQAHAGPGGYGYNLTVDLLTSGSVHAEVIATDYMSIDFGSDSSSRFLFRANLG